MTMPGCGKQKHSPTMGTEGHSEVCDKIPEHFKEQYGGGTQRSSGSLFYQEGGKTYASLPMEMLQNIQKSPLFEKMQKDCQAEGIEIPNTLMAKDPVTHVLTPQEYLQNVEAGTMPPMNNHQMMKEMAENVTVHDQTKFLMMEFREVECPTQPKTSTIKKTQVTNVALQTDSCDTLYVTKNTLTAYTIALVQNAQALQYDQMHVALQMARNQASLEMPL